MLVAAAVTVCAANAAIAAHTLHVYMLLVLLMPLLCECMILAVATHLLQVWC